MTEIPNDVLGKSLDQMEPGRIKKRGLSHGRQRDLGEQTAGLDWIGRALNRL
jgi:hypothetical protein